MAATPAEIEEFLAGPLVTWLSTCVKKPETLQVYETFFDGSPISEVLLHIDPEPSLPVPTVANLQGLSIITSRIKIFHCILKNIKAIYEEELAQVIVALPDCVLIGRAPASKSALEHLKLLILLLLGCAVQGPTKEVFITKIKELSLDAQHDIVECIKKVTDEQSVVLTLDWAEQSPEKLYLHLRLLASERDTLFQQWVTDLGQEYAVTGNNPSTNQNLLDGIESNHLAVELADWKAKLRKQRQELEEKTELLSECKEELEHTKSLVTKLKTENSDLLAEARKAKGYRDEVDAMRERAERVERLEAEAQRYRERLADTDFYRVRVSELREDNRVLLETREMLEAQLVRARQRADHVLELESDLLVCKQAINDITLEREADRERIQELVEENVKLQQVAKAALKETSNLSLSLDSDSEEVNSGDNSLSEQLTSNAQARALKLELENRKLTSIIDSLKENNFHESSKKILELEKEKKKLEIKLEQLVENYERVRQQNRELEELFKDSIQENRKLQANFDTNKVISERQLIDLQNERVKIEEFEKTVDSLTKEKQRVQTLCDTIKKRADDADKSLTHITEELQTVQQLADKGKQYKKEVDAFREKTATLEKENGNVQKDVVKLRESLELKDRMLDEKMELYERQEKEISRLCKDMEGLNTQVDKLQEYEQKSQELSSQSAVLTETITTLQKDLIAEKVVNEKYKSSFDKLGLNYDELDTDAHLLIQKMFANEEICEQLVSVGKERLLQDVPCTKCQNNYTELKAEQVEEWNKKCEKLVCDVLGLQTINETLQNDNAKMQVDISTLTSQVNSLQTQQTALQLANSQLVAEKEELTKQNDLQAMQHDTLLLDQATMRTLNEQLSSEYEGMEREQEMLKKANRDLRSAIRTTNEVNLSLETKVAQLEQDKETLKDESKSLCNLRTEHSKLKDDFRNLFTANERLKTEYRGLQEENKLLRSESSKLRLGNTEMQGELNQRSDVLNSLQLENAKLQQRCDTLYEMNHSLDSDRRALMDHVSKLLSQYHSLLLHSLEDKQHYHLEEKMFTDKLNNLCRQKEKLEEKIMEHYRKLDNASAKKRGFGATLARHVRKATEAMHKLPKNRRSWHEDTQRLTQSQYTLGAGSGESIGNDSDNSIEENAHTSTKRAAADFNKEVTLRKSQRDLPASHRNSISGDQTYPASSNLSLGSVGTRRTVYLSEDDPQDATNANNTSTTTTQPAVAAAAPPLLVYNKISTIIGEPHISSNQTAATAAQNAAVNVDEMRERDSTNMQRKKGDNAKENAIWYEYGCV